MMKEVCKLKTYICLQIEVKQEYKLHVWLCYVFMNALTEWN